MPASKKTTQVRLVANPVSQAFSMQYGRRRSEAVAPAVHQPWVFLFGELE